MRPILALSWLVRAQIGAKRGKLTLLGGIRGARLELEGDLGAPKEAPREPQRCTLDIGGDSTGANFGLGGPPK